MKHLFRICFAAIALLSTSALFSTVHAQQGYDQISPAMNTNDASKVEVLEFFWLGCPHCYQFEPDIEGWAESKPDHASFVREAPPLNPAWEQHSRGFYAAQVMGIENEFVKAMFEAIHEDKKGMRKPGDIAELASKLGVDKKKFQSTMKSFAVQTKLNRSMQLARAAGITGVPAVVINGKYLTSASKAGGQKGMIDVIKRTVEMEHKESGS